jgi:hypothetical protein
LGEADPPSVRHFEELSTTWIHLLLHYPFLVMAS